MLIVMLGRPDSADPSSAEDASVRNDRPLPQIVAENKSIFALLCAYVRRTGIVD